MHYTSSSNTVTYIDTIQDRGDSTLDEVEDIPGVSEIVLPSEFSQEHIGKRKKDKKTGKKWRRGIFLSTTLSLGIKTCQFKYKCILTLALVPYF